jgi:hypothetical protein
MLNQDHAVMSLDTPKKNISPTVFNVAFHPPFGFPGSEKVE